MLRQRLAAQGLIGEAAREPVTVVERLLAVQAQDARAARLALRGRSRGFTAAAIDRELTERRSLVISWLNRGTLHLVRSEDFPWLHALITHRQTTMVRRRLAEEGVSPAQMEKGVALIRRRLADEGPLTRIQLKERLDAAGVPTAGQAMLHLLYWTTIQGHILRGPMVDKQHAFVLVEDWLGPQPEMDHEWALAELARRYLVGHAPATDRDLAKWAGLPLGQVRTGLKLIAGELEQLPDGNLILRKHAPRPAESTTEADSAAAEPPPPRLLGAYDPVLHGWADRSFIIPREEDRRVVTINGIFRPTILIKGKVAGTWTMPDGAVALEPFRGLSAADRAALEAEAAAVRKFLG